MALYITEKPTKVMEWIHELERNGQKTEPTDAIIHSAQCLNGQYRAIMRRCEGLKIKRDKVQITTLVSH